MAKRTFRKLSNVEHVRLRTGMWLGQNSASTYDQHFFRRTAKTFSVKHEEITEVPAKLKCLDETVMNAVDEYNRNVSDKTISPAQRMNKLEIALSDDKKTISVEDNGRGIPPENAEGVFLHLMYGENFDDENVRDQVAGQNGVGISLVRIVSEHFKVITWHKNKTYTKIFTPTASFEKEMAAMKLTKAEQENVVHYFDEHGTLKGYLELTERQHTRLQKIMNRSGMVDRIGPNPKRSHGTKVEFRLVSKYFSNLSVAFQPDLLSQYLQDIAMTNPGLRVVFAHKNKKETFLFKKGMEDVFKNSGMEFYKFFYENKSSKITIESYLVEGQNKSLTWVNSNFASLGGSPVEYLENRICDEVRKKPGVMAMEKKLKTASTRNDVRNCFHMYNNFRLINPRFKSQDKSYLINDLNDELRKAVDKNLDRLIKKLDLVNGIKRQMEKRTAIKAMDDAAKDLRRTNRQNIPKLISAGSRPGEKFRTLFIAEGDSAIAGLRPARDPKLHSLFPLRGKPLNVKGMSLAKAMKNEEIKNIVAIMNLPLDGKIKSLDQLTHDRISIITDADYDGYAIRSLMMSFFYEYWPELFTLGVIHFSSAPLFEVEIENPQKKKKIFFCVDDNEYEKLLKKVTASGSKLLRKKRNKGLGETSKDAMQYTVDYCLTQVTSKNARMANKTQNLWFHKDFAADRRKTIAEYSQLFFDD